MRAELDTAAPLPATEDEQALLDDLQFAPEGDMKDLGAVTLLLGVRDNDLKGRGANDLSQLAEVHGDPVGQEEHCLRAGDHKEPGGSAAAVGLCRAFIRERVLRALGGLDASGNPDLAKRTSLEVHLTLRGHVDAPLPTYYVRMGQALHAVQDSFTHTYRTADQLKITVVLDWLDEVNGTLVESRDGPPHRTPLDKCNDPDPLRTARRVLATAATTEMLRATLDPRKTVSQKIAAVDIVLEKYLGYQPGCTFDNAWCDAPENQYKNAGACGVTTVGTSGGSSLVLPGAVLAGLGIARRLRRRKMLPVGGALALAGALLLGAGPARAQAGGGGSPKGAGETTTKTVKVPARPATPTHASKPQATVTTTTTPGDTSSSQGTTATKTVTPETTTTTVTSPTVADSHSPPPPTLVPVAEPGPRDVSATAWGGYLGGSVSVDKPALAAALGLRFRANSHWIFGLDGEWNPWIMRAAGVPTGSTTTVRAGVANLYATAILQFPLAYENFNLRSSLSLGGSYMLFNLYGAPKGSVGVFADVSLLGLAWKASRRFYLIINPMSIAMPIPQLKGVPLTYLQYRFTLGLEAYFG